MVKNSTKLSVITLAALATVYGTTEQANAIINIDSSTQYSNVLNNEKAVNIANAQAENEKRLARLYDVVAYLSSDATDAQKKQYVIDNLPKNDVLKDGDQYALYNTKGSIVGSKVGAEPIVRVGAGSDVTTDNNGFLTIENVSGITIDGKNYTFAGGTTSGEVTFGNTKENEFRTLTNVAAGRLSETSTDVVNGSQLHATNQALGATITKVNTNAGNIANNTTNIAKNTADIAKGWNLVDIAGKTTNIGAGGSVTVATTNNNLTANVTDGKLTIGLSDDINVKTVVADKVSTGNVSMSAGGINAGNQKITNVANGEVSATSKDAVNGSQLHAVDSKITNNTNNIAKGINYSDGTNTTNVQLGDTFKIVGDNKNIKTTISDKQVEVALADDIDVNSVKAKAVNVGTVVINDTGINAGSKKITNVANGTIAKDSKDAVNGGQLFDVLNNIDVGNVVKYDGDKQDQVTLAGTNGTKITNLKDGDVSATSKDAINGSQLHATNQNVANNTTNIAKNTADIAKGTSYSDGKNTTNLKLGETLNIVGDSNIKTTVSDKQVQVGLSDHIKVKSITTGDVSISEGGVNAGNKTITNVAEGVKGTDAVNVNQLNRVSNQIESNRKLASQGIASVSAMNIEYPEQRPGEWSTGVGYGFYDGESAMAIGATFLTDNGKYKVNMSYGQGLGSGSKPAAKASVAWTW